MLEKIALRTSAAVLILALMAALGLLLAGLARAAFDDRVPVQPLAAVPTVAVAADGKTTKTLAAAETQMARSQIVGAPVDGTPAAEPGAIADKLPLSDKLVVKRILQIDEPFVHGYYKWDDADVPAGELVVTIDLQAESISVFRGGYEIGAAVITFGDSLKPTPTGVFPISQKSKDHVSNIYGSPMPYMLRLTNDGIAIHAADVKWGWGTRGCIGVPMEFARLLFEQAKLGDRVIVTNGKMMNLGDALS